MVSRACAIGLAGVFALRAMAAPGVASGSYHQDHRHTPRLLVEPGVPPVVHGQLRQTVEAYLKSHAGQFGFNNDLSNLKLDRVEESLMGRHYRYRQDVGGVPVEDAEIIVSIRPDGKIYRVFNVYELPREVSTTIAAKGLPYLNSLPSVARQKKNFDPPRVETWTSPRHLCDVPGCPKCKDPKNIITHTATGPYWAPFVTWKATPVPKEVQWLRSGEESDLDEKWHPSIATFYTRFYKGSTDTNVFVSTISSEFSAAFHEAIATSGNYYAYGYYRDMCFLVVSPRTGKAFYLFRD